MCPKTLLKSFTPPSRIEHSYANMDSRYSADPVSRDLLRSGAFSSRQSPVGSHEVAGVAVRMALEIILMFGLCLPELPHRASPVSARTNRRHSQSLHRAMGHTQRWNGLLAAAPICFTVPDPAVPGRPIPRNESRHRGRLFVRWMRERRFDCDGTQEESDDERTGSRRRCLNT